MKIAPPIPGMVIRYGFLWSNEKAKGLEEGQKDRPCAIIVATKNEGEHVKVILAPITHSKPNDVETSIEISIGVCKVLGLDSEKLWLRFDELNTFIWPGFDLAKIPGKETYIYGMLPERLFEELKSGIVRTNKFRKTKITNRE